MLNDLSADIDSLNQQGLVSISEIDYYQRYISDIRAISNSQIEAWTTSTDSPSNGQLIDSTDHTLLPQTITIEQQNGSWFIMNENFLDAPAFCIVSFLSLRGANGSAVSDVAISW